MEWTNEKPKVPGLYWLKECERYIHNDKEEERWASPTIVELALEEYYSGRKTLEVFSLGDSLYCGRGDVKWIDDDSLWYGPLEPPKIKDEKK